eukprot:COSAG05_NODE_379_length_10567_cov_18.553687_14_plen_82_part_00
MICGLLQLIVVPHPPFLDFVCFLAFSGKSTPHLRLCRHRQPLRRCIDTAHLLLLHLDICTISCSAAALAFVAVTVDHNPML